MNKKDTLQAIDMALNTNNLQKAEALLQSFQESFSADATSHYLQGKIYMKRSEWGKAISSFKQSERLEPSGAAKECRLMLEDILSFYNKDMYNQ